ncbi:MAG: GreA/GreB family elongation factor [bacterium]
MKTPYKKEKITEKTYKFLVSKLEEMKTIGRKLLADKLDHYRNDETIEENSAISEVLDEKESLEKEISEIEETLEKSEVIKNGNGRVCKAVDIGCEVQLDLKGKKMKVEVVSSISADPEKKQISSESPLGMALMGKKVGETAKVVTPAGKTIYKIKKID